MRLNELTDASARAEALRIYNIIIARHRQEMSWLGQTPMEKQNLSEDSAFMNGMLALFRHARGEAVPAPIVMDFTADLLKLMFCGLANNTMALPPFKRMEDKPWAIAWRLSELRLGLEGEIEMDVPQLSHLLGESPKVIRERLEERGISSSDAVPPVFLEEIYEAIKQSSNTMQRQ